MKNILITVGIGFVALVVLLSIVFLIMSISAAYYVVFFLLFALVVVLGSYVIGYFIRDIWDMREYW